VSRESRQAEVPAAIVSKRRIEKPFRRQSKRNGSFQIRPFST